MTSQLPPNLLRLFAPRPPLYYIPPSDKDFDERQSIKYSGIGDIMGLINDHDQDYVGTETLAARKKRLAEEKKQRAEALKKELSGWTFNSNSNVTKDPYKTLFVSNLVYYSNEPYNITEEEVRKAIEAFGPVSQIIIVKKKGTEKPTGYAFIEFENEESFKKAYRQVSGMKLNSRKIIADVERGRTVAGWLPKKAGGGLGKKRVGRQIGPRSLPPSRPSNHSSGSRSNLPPRQGGRDFESSRPPPNDRGNNRVDDNRPPPSRGHRGPREDHKGSRTSREPPLRDFNREAPPRDYRGERGYSVSRGGPRDDYRDARDPARDSRAHHGRDDRSSRDDRQYLEDRHHRGESQRYERGDYDRRRDDRSYR